MTNSIKKGKAGEREFAKALIEIGIKARRGRQYCGANGNADVVTELPIYWEVKRCQNLNIEKAMKKAFSECKWTDIPCIAHRKNGGQWLLTIRLSDINYFSKIINDKKKGKP